MRKRQRVGGVRKKPEIKLRARKEERRTKEIQWHFPTFNVYAIHLEYC